MFKLEPNSAIIAVDYVDGDGGFLVADHIPGFQQYVDDLGVPTLDRPNDEGYHLVAFRGLYHNAIELTHAYRYYIGNHNPKSLGI